ncbi:1-acyl-sn-glycerol-3-phosphate acyltransferase [archaeon]|jgi:1-acyl-sn-glycerol-3-phosphate acyltransferase|nr:1-acyl-sn-glycerol-3-phosphate acyltransferase [archaeon]MBT3721682.1 1-acyl-sn-glycerol-3-phosphate acyltransferase [archaeon]MBT4022016.1 1-acyl-sn-glycerol-3-phosphate acyltransferase [archaeon]MBT4273173.1 1-acyl-sn-glycerol-3-phosphate acyltransferase [archaeon]MBT4460878.1 1-acyl-sn-glycerol-3-phosphate acyltransferase [archaeon]
MLNQEPIEELSYLEESIQRIRENPDQKVSLRKKLAAGAVSLGLKLFYNISVNGLENLDGVSKDDAQVIAWNHLSIIDPFIGLSYILKATGQEIHPIAKQEAWEEEGIMGKINRLGLDLGPSIPINRNEPLKTLKRVKKLLQGEAAKPKVEPPTPEISPVPAWIAIAPEGTRSYSGALLDFEPAGVGLLLNSDAKKVIPVNINYSLSKQQILKIRRLNWQRKRAYVNIGEVYEPNREKRGRVDQNEVAQDLYGILGKLTTITVDHVVACMLGQIAESGNGLKIDRIYDRSLDIFRALTEQGYNVQSGVFDEKKRKKYIEATLKLFYENGMIDERNCNHEKILTPFRTYMLDPRLNGIRSVNLKLEGEEVDDLHSSMSDEDKAVGKGFKEYNPVGYLRNNAGKEVEAIVKKHMGS